MSKSNPVPNSNWAPISSRLVLPKYSVFAQGVLRTGTQYRETDGCCCPQRQNQNQNHLAHPAQGGISEKHLTPCPVVPSGILLLVTVKLATLLNPCRSELAGLLTCCPATA